MEGEIDEKDVKKNEGEHHENGDDILLLVEFNDENKLLRIKFIAFVNIHDMLMTVLIQ